MGWFKVSLGFVPFQVCLGFVQGWIRGLGIQHVHTGRIGQGGGAAPWKPVEGRLRHNTMHNCFVGGCHGVGLRSLYRRLVDCGWGLNAIWMMMQTF